MEGRRSDGFDRGSFLPLPLLLDLAGIEWKGEDPTDSIVDPSYHWETPENAVIRKALGDAS